MVANFLRIILRLNSRQVCYGSHMTLCFLDVFCSFFTRKHLKISQHTMIGYKDCRSLNILCKRCNRPKHHNFQEQITRKSMKAQMQRGTQREESFDNHCMPFSCKLFLNGLNPLPFVRICRWRNAAQQRHHQAGSTSATTD